MRKAIVIAAVMVMGAGAALAASLNVPFFLDTATAGQGFPPTSGTQFFIGLKNTTGTDIVVTVNYRDPGGLVVNGTGTSTFSLPANSGNSFRPAVFDASVETVDVAGLRRSTSQFGSATISWTGAATDVQGRAVQTDPSYGSFSFLLPPGL